MRTKKYLNQLFTREHFGHYCPSVSRDKDNLHTLSDIAPSLRIDDTSEYSLDTLSRTHPECLKEGVTFTSNVDEGTIHNDVSALGQALADEAAKQYNKQDNKQVVEPTNE